MIATQVGVCVLVIGPSVIKLSGKFTDSQQIKYVRYATSEMFQFVKEIFK